MMTQKERELNPKKAQLIPINAPYDLIQDMRSNGIFPADDFAPKFTEQPEHFHIAGKKRSKGKKGWMIGSAIDGIYQATYSDWTGGEKFFWSSVKVSDISPEKKERFEKERNRQRQAARREQDKQDKQAIKRACLLWESAIPTSDHAYLRHKRVTLDDSRQLTKEPLQKLIAQNSWFEFLMNLELPLLVIPMCNEKGELQAAQCTDNHGTKRTIGLLRKGAHYTLEGEKSVIFMAEGLADIAAIHRLTGATCITTCNIGTLSIAVKEIKQNYQGARIIYCCDADFAGKNAGKKLITEHSDVSLVSPKFNANELEPFQRLDGNERKPATDFNDLANIDESRALDCLNAYKAEKKLIFTHTNREGNPLDTLENFEAVMNYREIDLRYNKVSKMVEGTCEGWPVINTDDEGNVKLAYIESALIEVGMKHGRALPYTKAMADRYAFNPVLEFIRSKPWDGESRLQVMFDTLTTTTAKDIKEMLLYRWFVSCAAALDDKPNFKAEGVLVLQSDEHRLGKGAWFMALLPPDLRASYIGDGIHLDPHNKDSVLTAISHWIVELSEIDSTFKRDIAALKAFITRTKDKVRPAYARVDANYPRRTIFAGSVNDDAFLIDETGNDRFWSLQCTAINYEHDIDMQQFWAEVWEIYQSGEQWWLTYEERQLLRGSNEDFQRASSIEEMVQSAYDPDAPIKERKLSATEVLIELGFDKPNDSQTKTAGRVLKKYFEKGRSGHKRYFRMPEKKEKGRH